MLKKKELRYWIIICMAQYFSGIEYTKQKNNVYKKKMVHYTVLRKIVSPVIVKHNYIYYIKNTQKNKMPKKEQEKVE